MSDFTAGVLTGLVITLLVSIFICLGSSQNRYEKGLKYGQDKLQQCLASQPEECTDSVSTRYIWGGSCKCRVNENTLNWNVAN